MSGKSAYPPQQAEPIMINIAKDFSAFPAGRYRTDGPNSGERFLEEFLLPELGKAVKAKQKLLIDLEGLKVCGSSFLESAFGGIVRVNKFPKEIILRTIEVVNTSPELDRYARSIIKHLAKAQPGELS